MSFEEILRIYKDEYGYITDIDNLVAFLKDNDEVSLSERNAILFAVLNHNLKQDEINKNSIKERKKRIHEKTESILETRLEEKVESIKSSLTDVSSYINSLKNCDDEDFLTEVLPSIYDNNYESIIMSILLYFYQEINIANQMIAEEKDTSSITYLKELIAKDKKLIKIVKEYNISEECDESFEEEKANTLIFLRRDNNSLYIDDDINDIAIEDDVLPILNDIKNNRIIREKRFHNHNELKGISAIRRRDSRIIFARIDNSTIVILGIFVKRCQNPQIYRDMLESRSKRFRMQRESIKEQIDNEEFLNDNFKIFNQTIEKLNSRKKYSKECL